MLKRHENFPSVFLFLPEGERDVEAFRLLRSLSLEDDLFRLPQLVKEK